MFSFLTNKIRLVIFKRSWRQVNSHNLTTPKKILDPTKVKIGNGTYGVIDFDSWNNPDEKLIIGNYCSIANEVKFVLGGNHSYQNLTTYPFANLYEHKILTAASKGKILIEDGVWIGTRALILSGVTIGKGAIVGAGTVVSKNIPAFAVVIGNPMKIIKYRFSEDTCARLLKLDYYKNMNKEFYLLNKNNFYSLITDDFIKILENEFGKSI